MNPKTGMRVRTTRLGSTIGMLIKEKHLRVRRSGITGAIQGWVPGHGGDVWWVLHDDGDNVIGAYCTDEMEQIAI
jgi:hypothetical protein